MQAGGSIRYYIRINYIIQFIQNVCLFEILVIKLLIIIYFYLNIYFFLKKKYNHIENILMQEKKEE